jgi:hypothetical protein
MKHIVKERQKILENFDRKYKVLQNNDDVLQWFVEKQAKLIQLIKKKEKELLTSAGFKKK